MEKFIDLISRRVSQAFEEAGLEGSQGKVTLSNRPDLCEYQCNGAMPAAKKAHRPPLELAERNKEYGITTLALLSNAFLNRVQEETGNIVAVTDVPGLSAIVNSLKSKNDTIRLSALDALIYLQREEYARELTPIYEALINTDNNTTVRAAAQFALDSLNNKKSSEQPEQITAAA